MYDIDWKPKAIKQLNRIGDKSDRIAIRDSVGALSGFPECPGIKRLVNHRNDYRLRVGRYRILFDVHTEISIISIEEVRKRDERTY
jgi:mRNA interferase RelE/StbE